MVVGAAGFQPAIFWEAFPFAQIPRYLLRDRDRIFGSEFSKDVKVMGISEVLSAPRSPWQRAYVERVIGTIRRECLDYVIVLNEASLYQAKVFQFSLRRQAGFGLRIG
jgi:transposase InsO family protein